MKHFLAAVVFFVFSASTVRAHGDEIHVMGTISKIDGTTITVTGSDGTSKSVVLDPETKFIKKSSPAKREDLKVGDRVVIHAKEVSNALHATEVKIGDTPKTAASQPSTHGRLVTPLSIAA